MQLLQKIKERAGQVNWLLLVFMILVLNVKLPVKIAAVIMISIVNWKSVGIKKFFTQRYLFFYFGMIVIAAVNCLLQFKTASTAYFVMVAIGISFWMTSAIIAYHLYTIVEKEKTEKIHATVYLFFILHIAFIFWNLLQIMIETGSINPYTYKGLNQKYFISTGDFISGITFDAPVSTAFICVFGLVYFLYRRQFLLSIAAMAALLILASNFANLVLIGVFVFAFIFYSNKIQKSFILIYMIMLVVFMAKVSPQNNEHVGRIFYQVINKPYDLPPVKIIPLDELKKEPDSVLTVDQIKKKKAKNYIDSMSAAMFGPSVIADTTILAKEGPSAKTIKPGDSNFYQFHESVVTEEKINEYTHFLNEQYSTEKRDSLKAANNWKHPGKWIAGKELFVFFKKHPGKILLGNGLGNFSSRLAFKATLLNIAGRYPAKFKYINKDFLDAHLYLYLYYHSQDQSQHEATNTPDAVYYQVLGEYGIIGFLLLMIAYFGFFIRRIRKKSFGLPLLFILAGAFFAEYWFEQFSIVVLFELLLFLDIKDMRREEQST
jgi:hypothetical protein